ncbi:MAG: hypothetical protein KAI43_14685 [Candidatus Aureabacteria bacterium]|nr:hypothetical protein [Candidatus Omnitrophota bacterium]MCK5708890.1 hypothetical protein [Candidatus Auribacterota bacterium]
MDEINKHINPAAKIKAEDAIFVWLDILGFKDETESDKNYKELKDMLIWFNKLFDNEVYYAPEPIADGVMLEIKENNRHKFLNIIKDVGKKQFQFIMEKKRFIRGGISVGSRLGRQDKKGEDKFCFISNGFTRAVRIESKHVDWPVIGTDEKNLKRIRGYFNVEEETEMFDFIKSFNSKGQVLYFIDFLEEANPEYFELLNRKIIEHKNSGKIRNKYVWLLRYYLHRFDNIDIPENLQGTVL